MPGRVITLRLPDEFVARVDQRCGARGRSPFFHAAAARCLDGDDPLAQLTAIAPAVAQALSALTAEERAKMKPTIRLIVDAWNTPK